MKLPIKKKTREETEIQRQIEIAIGALPDLDLLRNSIGEAVYVDKKSGREWTVPYGLGVGTPDIVGQLEATIKGDRFAIWIAFEVKVPGKEAEPHQVIAHERWRKRGVHVYVVHSVSEAIDAVNTSRARIAKVAA